MVNRYLIGAGGAAVRGNGTMQSDRLVVISGDCHAVGRPEDYAPYIEPGYRDRYDEFVAGQQAEARRVAEAVEGNRSLFSKEGTAEYEQQEAVAAGGREGQWDSDRRIKELEADGVAAEVVFPNGGVPFGGFGESAQHELRAVGNRAYNRWLADFCSGVVERRAPLATLAVHDISATVAEIHWARDHGFRGIILPTVPGDGLPPYYDPCYEPLWSACEDTGLPLHVHGGAGTPEYGDYGAVSMMIYATETTYFAHRPLWFLIWSGVLERHPGMTFVFTESCADWVPLTLRYLDMIYDKPFFSHIRATVKHRPSEYWERQCFVSASFMTAEEAAIRHEIGLHKLMWGSDYPHVEGVWPRSMESLATTMAGVPRDEAEAILSGTPASVYGFDLAALQPVADRIGPTASQLHLTEPAGPAQ